MIDYHLLPVEEYVSFGPSYNEKGDELYYKPLM